MSIEHKDVISTTRLTIAKIHGGFVIFMSVGLAILLANIQPSESQQLFALYGVILAGHAVALIVSANPTPPYTLSGLPNNLAIFPDREVLHVPQIRLAGIA